MPRSAATPCRAPGCTRLSGGGSAYCDEHRPAYRGDDDRGSSTQQGYGARWRKVRRMQLAREPLCRVCLEGGRVVEATQVDHITPRRDGGSDAFDNLQSLCATHHAQKTAREVNERRRRDEGRAG